MRSDTDHQRCRASAAATLLAVVAAIVLAGCGGEPDEAAQTASARQEATAPSWLLAVEGKGSWQDVEEEHGDELFHGWVDARVADVRYHKRVFVEVLAPYANGTFMRTLHPASYRGKLAAGHERWGSDAIEIYPNGGPYGAALAGPVLTRLRFQHDLTGDGQDEMLMTAWETLHGTGEPLLPPEELWPAQLSSPVEPAASAGPPQIFFAPFDDPGAAVIAQLDMIIAEQLAAPAERHTLHAAIYNIYDPDMVDKLIEAHQAGVEVRLLFDGRKLRPWYHWYDGDDRLLAAGVPLMGVKREGRGAMHDKLALFDGRLVATGSFNWEHGARFENHENMLLSERADLLTAYARRFEALAGAVHQPREHAVDPQDDVSVSFAPDEEPHRIVGQLLDAAQSSILLAMFTAKDVEYLQGGQPTSLFAKLAAAAARGVNVIAIVDHGVHEASEFHGIESDDDPSDEWLESNGVHVVRADNRFGPYASMHHKLVVIDGEVIVTGAFNWYHDAAYHNDEDQLVWRDTALAARCTGEIVDLLRRYDPAFDASAWPTANIHIEAVHDQTQWGDSVVLVGELEEAGGWDPGAGLTLSPSDWPVWRGTLQLPIGLRMQHKLVLRDKAGHSHWEQGANRWLTAPVDGDTTLQIAYRH